jgi:hypothetical protein
MKNAVLTVILMILIKMTVKTMNAMTIAPRITTILMTVVQIGVVYQFIVIDRMKLISDR